MTQLHPLVSKLSDLLISGCEIWYENSISSGFMFGARKSSCCCEDNKQMCKALNNILWTTY